MKNDNNWQEIERTEITKNIYLPTNEESQMKLEQKRRRRRQKKNVRHQIIILLKRTTTIAREKRKNRDHKEYILTL